MYGILPQSTQKKGTALLGCAFWGIASIVAVAGAGAGNVYTFCFMGAIHYLLCWSVLMIYYDALMLILMLMLMLMLMLVLILMSPVSDGCEVQSSSCCCR